jgi:hypothetical protein
MATGPLVRGLQMAQTAFRPLLAAAVVLALTGWGDGDYELVVPGVPAPICAKSEKVCLEAVDAIAHGRWPSISTHIIAGPVRCVPHPQCFPESSNYIKGGPR